MTRLVFLFVILVAFGQLGSPHCFAVGNESKQLVNQRAGADAAISTTGPSIDSTTGDKAKHNGNTKQLTTSEAVNRLKKGNARFVECSSRHPHEQKEWRLKLESGQHPFAVVLGCSDSRVPPELIFDSGLGDLFVVRVAGNVVDTDVIASIEYAVDHLEVPLVVVMGHSNCGAITAALDGLRDPTSEPAEIIQLLYQIEPATIGVDQDASHDKQVAATVKRNVELAVRRLSMVPDLRNKLATERVKISGAIYDMHTGAVDFLK